MITPRRPPSIVESFNYAIEGIIHVLRTQRNMRIHFAVAVVVLIAALVSDVTRLELIALFIAIAFVLIAEMINTAIEAAVDVASTTFDPMAKLAKDIGAGAVLIAAVNAIAVGYLVFSGQVADESSRLLDRLSEAPAELTLVALVLTIVLVIAMKALGGRGSPLRGGWPSGHAAIAFAAWMAVTLVIGDSSHRFLVSSLDADHGVARGPDEDRGGRPHDARGRGGRRPRRARDARGLPGVLRVTDEELLARADAIAERAYAPYSNFTVGCAVLCRDGTVIEGVNVENGAYPLGVCAERTAFSRAIVEGHRPGDFVVAAVTASPCGGCRQWFAEMGVERVVFRNGGRVVEMTVDEILPEQFEL